MQRHIKQGNALQLIMSSLLLNSNIISNTGTGKKVAALHSLASIKTFLLTGFFLVDLLFWGFFCI